MLSQSPIDDSILGRLQFDADRNEWRSEFAMPDGTKIAISISPEDCREPLESPRAIQIRDTIHWLQQNDAELRLRVARKVFDHWKDAWAPDEDEEGEFPNPQTPQEFAELLR